MLLKEEPGQNIKISRETTSNKFIGAVRIMSGIMFIVPGMMKLLLPVYGEAWSIQLVEADIPLYTFTYNVILQD